MDMPEPCPRDQGPVESPLSRRGLRLARRGLLARSTCQWSVWPAQARTGTHDRIGWSGVLVDEPGQARATRMGVRLAQNPAQRTQRAGGTVSDSAITLPKPEKCGKPCYPDPLQARFGAPILPCTKPKGHRWWCDPIPVEPSSGC